MGWEWRAFIPLTNEEVHCFPSTVNSEKRTDVYYVENEKNGVKKRNGEGAYEVKVLIDSKDFGAEKYKKNLVPSTMGHKYQSYIHIDVYKERQKRIEYSNDGSMIFETSFVCAKNKWWKSICWEGTPTLIYHEIKKYFELEDDWIKSDLSDQLPEGNMICGYPKWVTII